MAARRPELGIRELYLDHEAANRLSAIPPSGVPTSWEQFFLRVDQALLQVQRTAEFWLFVRQGSPTGRRALAARAHFVL